MTRHIYAQTDLLSPLVHGKKTWLFIQICSHQKSLNWEMFSVDRKWLIDYLLELFILSQSLHILCIVFHSLIMKLVCHYIYTGADFTFEKKCNCSVYYINVWSEWWCIQNHFIYTMALWHGKWVQIQIQNLTW